MKGKKPEKKPGKNGWRDHFHVIGYKTAIAVIAVVFLLFASVADYILLRGYDENGFFVNDPNRRSNSERQWDFDTLASQMKNLWGIYSLSE